MTTQGNAGGPQENTTVPAAQPDDQRQLAEEIEQTREQLGETVQALTAKTDVKGRAQDKVAELTARLKDSAAQTARQAAAKTAGATHRHRGQLAPAGAAAAAAAVTVLACLVMRRRRRW